MPAAVAARCRAPLQSSGSAWFCLGLRGLPAPGLEPMSPALTGGLSTTGPPGKSIKVLLKHSEKKSFIPGFQQFICHVPSRDFLKGYSISSLRGLIQWIIVLIKVGKSGRLFFSLFFPVHSGTLNCIYIGPFNIASQVSNVLFFFCLILFASFGMLLLCLHIH